MFGNQQRVPMTPSQARAGIGMEKRNKEKKLSLLKENKVRGKIYTKKIYRCLVLKTQ